MRFVLLLSALLSISMSAFCQASWTYHIGFALNDRDGEPIIEHRLASGECRVFTHTTDRKRVVKYNSELGFFYASGMQTWPYFTIGMINNRDSTAVVLPFGSERVMLTNWPTTPGFYVLSLDKEGKIAHPEAILPYQGQFRSHSKLLFALTITDWDKYRIDALQGRRELVSASIFAKENRVKIAPRR